MKSSKTILSSIIWKMLERISAMLISLMTSIVLSLLLDPSEHGLLGMVTVFVTISQIFVTSGLGSALIQKKDADELDFSSMFWLNLVISVFLYLMVFIAAPFIADFFGYPVLSSILRVIALQIIIAGIYSIQGAYISRNMLFKNYFLSTLVGKVISGVVGVVLAFGGAGVWALVFQHLSLIFIETLVIWFYVRWRPTFVFSLQRVKKLYSFAWKIMVMSFFLQITDNVRNLIIGKKYTSSDLGFFNKGKMIPNTIIENVSTALGTVMLPVLSEKQDDLELIKKGCRRWIDTFAYAMFPLFCGIAVTANNMIWILYRDKWLPAVFFLQICCAQYASGIVEVPVRRTLEALGRADQCLIMQIIKSVISVGILLATFTYSVKAIAWGALLGAVINVIISMVYAHVYLKYTPLELLSDILPALLLSASMGVCVYLVSIIIKSNLFCLIVQVIVGAGIYLALSVLTKNKSFTFCLSLMKSFIKKKPEEKA